MHLQTPDEPRVAGIATEMLLNGDLIVPELNGKPFLEKPPLYFWGLATAFKIFGINAGAGRLLSAIMAILTVFIVFFISIKMKLSAQTALLTGIILATSAEFWMLGRRCLIDMQLACFITLAMLCFYSAINSKSKRLYWEFGFICSLALAVMSKALVGFAIPLPALGVWLIITRNTKLRDWLLLCISPLIAVIPVCLWLYGLYNHLGWNAVYVAAWTNNIGRFSGSHPEHLAPFYYYFLKFPAQFLPWTIFIPGACKYWISTLRNKIQRDNCLFLLSWFFIPFLLLCVSAGKRAMYLLPLYPAIAIFTAGAFIPYLSKKTNISPKWVTIPSALLSFVFFILGITMGFFIAKNNSILLSSLIVTPVLLSSIYVAIALKKKKRLQVITGIMAGLAIIFITISYAIFPTYYKSNSFYTLFQKAKYFAKKSGGGNVCLYRGSERLLGAGSFYLQKKYPTAYSPDELYEMLSKKENSVVIALKRCLSDVERNYEYLAEFKINRKPFVILRIPTKIKTAIP